MDARKHVASLLKRGERRVWPENPFFFFNIHTNMDRHYKWVVRNSITQEVKLIPNNFDFYF